MVRGRGLLLLLLWRLQRRLLLLVAVVVMAVSLRRSHRAPVVREAHLVLDIRWAPEGTVTPEVQERALFSGSVAKGGVGGLLELAQLGRPFWGAGGETRRVGWAFVGGFRGGGPIHGRGGGLFGVGGAWSRR